VARCWFRDLYLSCSLVAVAVLLPKWGMRRKSKSHSHTHTVQPNSMFITVQKRKSFTWNTCTFTYMYTHLPIPNIHTLTCAHTTYQLPITFRDVTKDLPNPPPVPKVEEVTGEAAREAREGNHSNKQDWQYTLSQLIHTWP